MKINLVYLLFLLPNLAFADSSVEAFFKGLEGKWHGEVESIYKIDMTVQPLSLEKPWALQAGHIVIEEGDTVTYDYELSTNESALDQEKVYFFKLKSAKTKIEEVYTLSSRAVATNPLSFWRHISNATEGKQNIESAKAVKIFRTGNVLTLGFVEGNLYCHNGANINACGTDGYRPFEMMKMKK